MLAVLCACGALARTLSMCLDAMTGGLARIMILGMNKKLKKKLLKLKLDFKYLMYIFRPQFTSKRAMARCIGCWCGIFSHWHVYVGPRGMLMISLKNEKKNIYLNVVRKSYLKSTKKSTQF